MEVNPEFVKFVLNPFLEFITDDNHYSTKAVITKCLRTFKIYGDLFEIVSCWKMDNKIPTIKNLYTISPVSHFISYVVSVCNSPKGKYCKSTHVCSFGLGHEPWHLIDNPGASHSLSKMGCECNSEDSPYNPVRLAVKSDRSRISLAQTATNAPASGALASRAAASRAPTSRAPTSPLDGPASDAPALDAPADAPAPAPFKLSVVENVVHFEPLCIFNFVNSDIIALFTLLTQNIIINIHKFVIAGPGFALLTIYHDLTYVVGIVNRHKSACSNWSSQHLSKVVHILDRTGFELLSIFHDLISGVINASVVPKNECGPKTVVNSKGIGQKCQGFNAQSWGIQLI